MKKLISISILCIFVFLPKEAVLIEIETTFHSSNFGINASNNAPATNPIYIYGDGTVSEWIGSYSGVSLGPFNDGPFYSVVMYGNTTGSHTFTFSGPAYDPVEDKIVTFSESITTSSGSATFHPGYLVGNSSASITYNGM